MTDEPSTDAGANTKIGAAPARTSRREVVSTLMGGGGLAVGIAALARTEHVESRPTSTRMTQLGSPANVKDYGATGDGATDDTAAVQSALNDAQKTRRPVYLPSGTYILSRALTADGPVHLSGDGMWESVVIARGSVISASELLTATDLGFDRDGRHAALFELDGRRLQTFEFERCRFANLAGDSAAPAAIELRNPGDGRFIDCLWHNPARYAGFGNGVRITPDMSAKRLVFLGDNRFLWLNNGIRVEPFEQATHFTSLDSLVVDGAYFDGFWWLLPASHSGSGSTVSYTATGLTDSTADFRSVAAAARPNVTNVRAMPVRARGSMTKASSHDVIDSKANFAAAGVLRGDIVRSGDSWAVVAQDADPAARQRLIVEEWLDNSSLRPTGGPSVGASYIVYGVLIAAATRATRTTLTVENWRDRHGKDVLPTPRTRYEVLQTRPTYLLFTGPGGVTDMSVQNSNFRRGWADLLSVRANGGSRVIGNRFSDGQESGLVVSNGHSGHILVNNSISRVGNYAIYVDGSQSIISGNRISGAQTQRILPLMTDILLVNGTSNLVAYNLADTGVDSQTAHSMIVNQSTTGSMDNVFAFNRKVSDRGEIEVVFEGSGNTGNEVVGSRSVSYTAGAVGQLLEIAAEGAPEGRVIAAPGSTFRRTDGRAGSTFYVKESGTGATGWAAK